MEIIIKDIGTGNIVNKFSLTSKEHVIVPSRGDKITVDNSRYVVVEREHIYSSVNETTIIIHITKC